MDREDWLYILGTVLIGSGAGLYSAGAGLIAAGAMVVLPPVVSLLRAQNGKDADA